MRAGGKGCLESLTRIFNEVLFENKLLDNWVFSSLVATYERKGYPLSIKSYRGIKVLEHVLSCMKGFWIRS